MLNLMCDTMEMGFGIMDGVELYELLQGIYINMQEGINQIVFIPLFSLGTFVARVLYTPGFVGGFELGNDSFWGHSLVWTFRPVWLIVASLSVVSLLFLWFIWMRNSWQTYRVSGMNTIGYQEQEVTKDLIIRSKIYMSKDKEKAILDVVKKYEKNQYFLTKDVCLNALAMDSGVSEKYIGYVIKKHRGKDFSSYINELRISYIVERLLDNPMYLNYKISYLASECGFSTHSSFSLTFKKVVGISPSCFIQEIKVKSIESKSS